MLRRAEIVEYRRSNQRPLARGIRLARIVRKGLSFNGIHRFPRRIARMFRQHTRIGERQRRNKTGNEGTGPYDERGLHDGTSLWKKGSLILKAPHVAATLGYDRTVFLCRPRLIAPRAGLLSFEVTGLPLV